MSSLSRMLASRQSSTGDPNTRAPSRRASIINFFKHRKSKDHSQDSTEPFQALGHQSPPNNSQQQTQPPPNRHPRRHHSEAPPLNSNPILDFHPPPPRRTQTQKHQPQQPPPPPQQPSSVDPSNTELSLSTNQGEAGSSPKTATTTTISHGPGNPSLQSAPQSPPPPPTHASYPSRRATLATTSSTPLATTTPPPLATTTSPPTTTTPTRPATTMTIPLTLMTAPTPLAPTTTTTASSRPFNSRGSIRAALGRFSWSGALSDGVSDSAGDGVDTAEGAGGGSGRKSSWGSWGRHGKKGEGKDKRNKLRKNRPKGSGGGGGGGKGRGGGGDEEREDKAAAERRKAEEVRAFKANEAARIIRASCMAGSRIRKRKHVTKRILEHVSVNEQRNERWANNKAMVGRGRANRAEQVQKLAQFSANIDPYPELYWRLWGGDIPTGLEMDPLGELWEGGELERVGRGLPCLAGV